LFLVHPFGLGARGDPLLGPATTQQILAAWMQRPPVRPEPVATTRLGPREREVIELVAAGHTNAEIAADLSVTESTVKTHLARAQHKLGLRDRIHVVNWAYQTGLAGHNPTST
jgi:DNA-binding NarL/FixJ family response regulator